MTIRAQTSIFARLVVIAIAMATLLTFVLWFTTDRTIHDALEDTARDAVDVDLAGLVDIHASGGTEELQRRISDRLAITPIDGTTPHYLLLGSGNERLAGDIVDWPALDPTISENGEILIGAQTRAFARATLLGPELRLLVAHEANDGQPLLQRVALTFFAGGVLFVFIVGIASQFAATQLKRRISTINSAFLSADTAALELIQPSNRPDEIDELAAHSSAALKRVKALMEAYKDSSDQVAHEIRTPLMHLDASLVKGLAANPSEEVAGRLHYARSEIRALVGTLESLLDITASNARRGDSHGLKPVDLSALCERICELYADSAEESGHVLEWSVIPGVTVNGEEDQLARLVTNLLDNALKYVPSGGTITLAVEPGPRLTIADDGPGILPEDQSKIFDRFYRSGTAKTEASGAGLGLALSKAIAERHGLTLELRDSRVGACFVVEKATV